LSKESVDEKTSTEVVRRVETIPGEPAVTTVETVVGEFSSRCGLAGAEAVAKEVTSEVTHLTGPHRYGVRSDDDEAFIRVARGNEGNHYKRGHGNAQGGDADGKIHPQREHDGNLQKTPNIVHMLSLLTTHTQLKTFFR
jgi:hypothetical protein